MGSRLASSFQPFLSNLSQIGSDWAEPLEVIGIETLVTEENTSETQLMVETWRRHFCTELLLGFKIKALFPVWAFISGTLWKWCRLSYWVRLQDPTGLSRTPRAIRSTKGLTRTPPSPPGLSWTLQNPTENDRTLQDPPDPTELSKALMPPYRTLYDPPEPIQSPTEPCRTIQCAWGLSWIPQDQVVSVLFPHASPSFCFS